MMWSPTNALFSETAEDINATRQTTAFGAGALVQRVFYQSWIFVLPLVLAAGGVEAVWYVAAAGALLTAPILILCRGGWGRFQVGEVELLEQAAAPRRRCPVSRRRPTGTRYPAPAGVPDPWLVAGKLGRLVERPGQYGGPVTQNNDLTVLHRAVDQISGLLDTVRPEVMGDQTPCAEWTVANLVDHIVVTPLTFDRMMRGESIDWSAPTPSAGADPAGAFRTNAEGLLSVWQTHGGAAGSAGLDMQCAELSVHTWDLATALRRSTAGLDPEPAERGLAFMRANLTDDNRGGAFGPELPAPQGGDAYQRIAAFAGRSV